MSSRNEYLTDSQKKSAEVVFRSLGVVKNLLGDGVLDAGVVRKSIKKTIATEKNITIDYVSVVHLDSLLEVDGVVGGDVLVSVAVFVGSVRLIDNVFYGF